MPFSDGAIDIIIRDYICAQCFDDLVKQPAENRKWLAVCHTHGNIETVGRVTRKWAEKHGQKLAGAYLDIRVKQKRTEHHRPADDILKEMGLGG